MVVDASNGLVLALGAHSMDRGGCLNCIVQAGGRSYARWVGRQYRVTLHCSFPYQLPTLMLLA